MENCFQYRALPPTLVSTAIPDWYTYKGGAEACNNPATTDATGDAYSGAECIAARLVPASVLREKPNEMFNLLFDIVSTSGSYVSSVNYTLGGNTFKMVGDKETSVRPDLRGAAWNLFTDPTLVPKVLKVLPNTVSNPIGATLCGAPNTIDCSH